jgi:AcrR family transcriptional regulator
MVGWMNTSGSGNGSEVAFNEQDARTRNRLIRAGVQVFDRKGYDAASVREIVELAGVTKPALYYHFGSKEGLLLAILKDAAQQFADVMARTAARPGNTRDRLMAMCEELYGLFGMNVPVIRVAHTVALGPSEATPHFDFTVFEREMNTLLERIIEQGQAQGEVCPGAPADIALAVMGVIGMLAGRQLHAPNSPPMTVEGMRRVMGLVFDGVLRDCTQREPAGAAVGRPANGLADGRVVGTNAQEAGEARQ